MASRRPDGTIGKRKTEHLDICTRPDEYPVEGGTTMLGEVHLIHRALPEIDADGIDPSVEFLGHRVSLPIFISSMTGGSAESFRANKDLATIAQQAGIPVGMGSIRVLLRKPELIDHFMLKQLAPDVPVFANIGGVQLQRSDHDRLVSLVAQLEVDGVAVHLNPGQELAQPEGDRDFSGVLRGIARLCADLPVPVIAKETGFGIAPDEVAALLAAGVRYVDVAGSGGTNWITVESHRLAPDRRTAEQEFAEWGLPTAACLAASRHFPGRILASGGIRTGMDVLRSLALGAVSAGLALPFIRAVRDGGVAEGLGLIDRIESAIRVGMVLTGSRTVDDVRNAPIVISDALERMVAVLTGLHRV